ncbi:MAG: SGNH/GDSL hydrolase family protein [Pseudomonadota bacterium]|nr:SGNH/GDSL hydrolase family protein [Pseudomonadota bacterium]
MNGKRAVLACVALLVGVAIAEGALRVAYPTLPSMAGLIGQTTWQEGDAIQRCDARALVPVRGQAEAPQGRHLLVVGDSVALGFGVAPAERFGARLAARLSSMGERWSEVNGARAGGTACVTLGLTREALARSHAHLAVVALFADDLMQAPRFWVNGHRVAFPDTVHVPWLRWAISRSYAANTVWWGVETAFFDRSQSLSRDTETLDAFRDALADVRAQAAQTRTPVVLTLLPAAGQPACATGGTEPEVCDLGEETDRIAALLDAWWPGWVDLRGVFDGGDYRLEAEKVDARLDIHPNAAGHARIADALFPAVSAAVPR